ncbi:MAG: amidophosphoribosyltransferase [Paludibacteraceae bacterium]|nr:amidophosphoribosyltransferase [Paludibacteraceae bacterium]MBP5480635.1 amidophosphoribosyltransferase [Paludibacteraceae bacterium]
METLRHECGIAMIRLLKPLDYYRQKYGTDGYGLGKLYLMMEKQHNRGQEGAGVACVKLHSTPGHEYMFREKAEGKDAITKVFSSIGHLLATPSEDDPSGTPPFQGELLMGHLRYSTTGKGGLRYVHPFLRRNNWRAKNLCICGNFNMTNIDHIFQLLTEQGQYPRIYSDSYIMLELMGHRLDREVERLYREAKESGRVNTEITDYVDTHVDISNVLSSTMPHFDGGYVVCGLTGSGEMFSMRDPWGIRPAFFYRNDELVAVASERPVLQTTFDLSCDEVEELKPGQALIVGQNGKLFLKSIIDPKPYSPCVFERIYFSRGNDQDIYRERKMLGRQLQDAILKAIDGDVENTVFSYIPNTAEVAYYGMVEGFRENFSHVRAEKVVSKDIKLRTFITEGKSRNDLAAHVYDITYGSVRPGVDNLVVIDDSIVRGTTLHESIIKILDRLHPKCIVIVSSAPQIRYPDFYGIDMSRIGDFIAFKAAVALRKDRGEASMLKTLYDSCAAALADGGWKNGENVLRQLYEGLSVDELNQKMVEILCPEGVTTPVKLVFQSIEGLHHAIPKHPGDWYFTGHYPTEGGLRMLYRSYMDWYESGKNNG